MVLNLDELPLVTLRPDQWRWEARQTQSLLIEEGRAYRRSGFPIKACPRLRFKDMEIDWKNGWRWEDEEIKARRSKARR